jgi:hypothetical protein
MCVLLHVWWKDGCHRAVYVRCWREVSITSSSLCLLHTKNGWLTFLARPVCCAWREVWYHFEPGLCFTYEQSTGIISSRSLSRVRTEDGYHFEPSLCLVYEQKMGITSSQVCVLCTNSRRVSFRVGLCLVYEKKMGTSSSPVCVLCTNRRRVSLRAGLCLVPIRKVWNDDGRHFQPALYCGKWDVDCLFGVALTHVASTDFNPFVKILKLATFIGPNYDLSEGKLSFCFNGNLHVMNFVILLLFLSTVICYFKPKNAGFRSTTDTLYQCLTTGTRLWGSAISSHKIL